LVIVTCSLAGGEGSKQAEAEEQGRNLHGSRKRFSDVAAAET